MTDDSESGTEQTYCDECGSEIRLTAKNIIQHGSCNRGCHTQTFTVSLVMSCDCTTKKPQRTDMGSIDFNGQAPEQWQ